MKTILSSRGHHYIARVSIFLLAVALMVGTVSCAPTPTKYTLTMAANPVAGGTATDLTNASPYTAGTPVAIEAVANPGYVFVNWSAPAGTFGSTTAATTTFTMPAQNVTVTANFGGGGRQAIILDFGTFWPATDFQVTLGHKEWAKAISDRVMAETTNWTVVWNWYYSQTPTNLRTGIQAGTWDVITSGPGYYSGVYPLWQGPEYPANTTLVPRKNAYTMSMALQALWGNFTALQTEFAAKEPNVVVMHYWSTGPGYFLMVEGKNVTQLADFYTPAKKKIRAANPASVACISALNATPVSMAMNYALQAFQAGTINGILCPTDTPKGFGLSAYVRSCTYAPFSYQFVFYKLMNKATYTALPAEVRAIVDSVNAKYCEYYGKLRTWGELDGLGFCRSNLGWNTSWWEYNLPVENATEYANWLAAVYPSVVNNWTAGNTTREQLWGNFTAIAQWADATYGGWSPGSLGPPPGYASPAPPAPPTFP